MVREVAGRGAVPSEIDVQIFGGAEIAARQGYAVGRRNVAAARKALAAHGLVITRAVVGGRYGRVVDFDTKSGRAFVTTLPAAATVASAILSEAS
jgi:chemotaxis receptor (MCP) glutamine deamidase CheD